LLLDGGVLRLGGSLGLLKRGGKFLIVRRRVDGFFGGATSAKLFLQIDRIGRCETALIRAPGPQADELRVERPRDAQQKHEDRDQNPVRVGPAFYRVIWRKLRQTRSPSEARRCCQLGKFVLVLRFACNSRSLVAWLLGMTTKIVYDQDLDAEPRRLPDIFNAEHEPQENCDRQEEHGDQENVHGDGLNQAHLAVNLPAV